LNYLGRRTEKYHYRIPAATTEQGVKSIHESLRSKEENLHEYLVYDKYTRSFSLDRALSQMPTLEDFYRGVNLGEIIEYDDYRLNKKNQFQILFRGQVKKTIEISEENKRTLHIIYDGDIGLFGTEFSLGIFHADLTLNSKYPLRQKQLVTELTELNIEAKDFPPILFKSNQKFTLLAYPIETVSSSEAGFEKNFQGLNLLFVFEKLPELLISL
jgi:hypothetical protein